MPAVGAQVDGDAARARSLADRGGGEHVGLRVVRINSARIARLAQRGDVVNVDAEFHDSILTTKGTKFTKDGCHQSFVPS